MSSINLNIKRRHIGEVNGFTMASSGAKPEEKCDNSNHTLHDYASKVLRDMNSGSPRENAVGGGGRWMLSKCRRCAVSENSNGQHLQCRLKKLKRS